MFIHILLNYCSNLSRQQKTQVIVKYFRDTTLFRFFAVIFIKHNILFLKLCKYSNFWKRNQIKNKKIA